MLLSGEHILVEDEDGFEIPMPINEVVGHGNDKGVISDRLGSTTILYCHLDELTNTLLVENLEWASLRNFFLPCSTSVAT